MGVVLVGCAAAAILAAVVFTPWDAGGAAIIGPAALAVSIPILRRQARREGDPGLFWLLLAALILKFVGAVIRHFVAFQVYEGGSDAVGYHQAGIRWMEQIRAGELDSGAQPLTGTNFVELVTGVVYTVTGPTLLGGFLVFSWLGFWGLFLFYRAFTIAVPEGNRRTYARLLFFLPSLVFWPSSVGKEAWMMLTLGIASFGAATILEGRTLRGLLPFGGGLWLAAQVRPHIAGLLALSAAGALLIRRSRRSSHPFAPLAKLVSVTGVGLIALVVAIRAERYLVQSRVDTSSGVAGVLAEVNRRTAQGGSEFSPTVVESPPDIPLAVFTALFRPLAVEASSPQVAVSAAETSFLLAITLGRWRWILRAIQRSLRHPYLALAIAGVVLTSVAFSAIANFGILARERVQVLPFFLALLSLPPRSEGRRGDRQQPLR
ncbi:MAG TPA: hypothetical protein VNO34_00540 [Actinomycetota bacterium]|nr:hypothetical protein [Actinomycetota bacterium]